MIVLGIFVAIVAVGCYIGIRDLIRELRGEPCEIREEINTEFTECN